MKTVFDPEKKLYTLSILVRDIPGVLSQVARLFSRKGYMLSQLRTLTVLRVISSTVPLALPSGICIQSPMRIILFCDNCTPATNPRMLSLNMSISTAAEAPSPVSSTVGDLSISTAVIIMPPTK